MTVCLLPVHYARSEKRSTLKFKNLLQGELAFKVDSFWLLSWRFIMKYFLRSFSPLIQDEQLSVSG